MCRDQQIGPVSAIGTSNVVGGGGKGACPQQRPIRVRADQCSIAPPPNRLWASPGPEEAPSPRDWQIPSRIEVEIQDWGLVYTGPPSLVALVPDFSLLLESVTVTTSTYVAVPASLLSLRSPPSSNSRWDPTRVCSTPPRPSRSIALLATTPSSPHAS